MKSRSNKSEKAMNNLSQSYPDLQNQCILPLKSHLKSHSKYAAAEKVKDAINSMQQRVLKADLNLESVYGKYMKLLEYFDTFMEQGKVAQEAGVDFGSKTLVGLVQDKLHKKDSTVLSAPAYQNPLIKLKKNMKIENLWEVVKYNLFC